MQVNEQAKLITIWLDNKENTKASLPMDVEEEIEKYRKKNYMLCMYQSGNEDIKQNFLNLVLNNVR